MAVSTINKTIHTKDIVVTTGTSQYDGYYFGDASGVPDGYFPIGACVINTSAGTPTNVYADVTFRGRDIRVWTVRPSATVYVRISYLKA